MFQDANSFPRTKFKENFKLRATGNFQGNVKRILFVVDVRFENWGISLG